MHERTVVSPSVGEDAAGELGEAFGAEANVALTPRELDWKLKEYRNFRVEYAFENDNFIVHFYVSHAHVTNFPSSDLEYWWLNDFAMALNIVAQEYFGATSPRLQAAYTSEVASWWFRAQGYGELLDPLAFLLGFFERLDGSFLARADLPPVSIGAMDSGSVSSSSS